MKIKCPDHCKNHPEMDNDLPTIFLAGSISNAVDWQTYTEERLSKCLNTINPRRLNFDQSNPAMEREQITWEYEHLEDYSDILLFYFSHETVAPITLFEYGCYLLDTDKRIYVAIHPDYPRKNDVIIQTELRRPSVAERIRFDLEDSINDILKYYE